MGVENYLPPENRFRLRPASANDSCVRRAYILRRARANTIIQQIMGTKANNKEAVRAESKRIEKRETRRQDANLKKCKTLTSAETANLGQVATLMMACKKLNHNDDYTDCVEAGLGEHILDNATVAEYLETSREEDINETEYDDICKEVFAILFHNRDIVLTSTTSMTDMPARKAGETLGAFQAQFLMLNKARAWVHALYGQPYVADSAANASLWLRKVNCQPITLALTSRSMGGTAVTAAQLYTAADELLRNGTSLDEAKGHTKELDLNFLQLQGEIQRNNLNTQQSIRENNDRMRDQLQHFKEELRNRDEAALSYLNSSHQDKKHRNHLNTEQSSRENNDRLRDQHARRFRSERFMRGGLP
jgi:hypothetical protein